MKKFLKTVCILIAAACFFAALGAAGAIERGAALADIAPGALALMGGVGIFSGLAYLLG